MKSFNATVELTLPAGQITEEIGDDLIERFIDWHPAIGVSPLGRAELIITLPAETFTQAASTVAALTAGLEIVRTTVETTEDFDRRSLAELPPLLSVTEAADTLGLTRAGVQKRILAGTLPAVRVGTTWAIPEAAVESATMAMASDLAEAA